MPASLFLCPTKTGLALPEPLTGGVCFSGAPVPGIRRDFPCQAVSSPGDGDAGEPDDSPVSKSGRRCWISDRGCIGSTSSHRTRSRRRRPATPESVGHVERRLLEQVGYAGDGSCPAEAPQDQAARTAFLSVDTAIGAPVVHRALPPIGASSGLYARPYANAFGRRLSTMPDPFRHPCPVIPARTGMTDAQDAMARLLPHDDRDDVRVAETWEGQRRRDPPHLATLDRQRPRLASGKAGPVRYGGPSLLKTDIFDADYDDRFGLCRPGVGCLLFRLRP